MGIGKKAKFHIFRPNEEDKKSLGAGSIGASETDSMMEYAEGDALRFTEDGSFIGNELDQIYFNYSN